ncbi:hypothetical protein EJ05DRAFT_511834 [Pseudovirgaria hyperparasitica]|uniref:UBX domain-containing protein n=1 Tax=Pseudovirgaria hyperparasitica TaxID=470096 RepID=A0A6A6W2L8_9PEZI|nr:uncharacterized protein EJ05DRAFT_511834 [Pseudovirgaria hyperparasitica]KAF2757092.1 hypothetical protein EJ05DRAFT_511834 [Pseudovirgaria hyperparasitica]
MASHVVVVDPSARRATVKTQPQTYLTDVRDEACKKLGVPGDQFTLKFNQKQIDLSLTIRLSGLPQGAKLDLIQQSRSPTVVSVALQLPASEDNARLTQKFPSNTSLWQILRVFESSPAPRNPRGAYNFTQRAATDMNDGSTSGAGRLNYEAPVLNVMGRERSSFTELQQTLAQLGLSGSVLLRLSYRNSGKPLEEAMSEISQFFKTSDNLATEANDPPTTTHLGTVIEKSSPKDVASVVDTKEVPAEDNLPTPMEDVVSTSPQDLQKQTEANATPVQPTTGPGDRPVVIFSPPSTSTPQAASQPHNSNDYDLSVDQARRYQTQLQDLSRNKRLPSDKEIEAADKAKAEKLAAVTEVKIRIRVPDQTQVEVHFTRQDTTKELFDLVRSMLEHGDQPFLLRYTSPKGGLAVLKEGTQKLVSDLGFHGRVLITCTWDDSVPIPARRPPSLKQEWREKAQVLKVETIATPVPEQNPGGGSSLASSSKGKGKMTDGDKESKLKAMLNKGLFKKK